MVINMNFTIKFINTFYTLFFFELVWLASKITNFVGRNKCLSTD